MLADELREALAPAIQLLRPLGEGGMGQVWLARDATLKRLVAVKVLHVELANEAAARARFEREAEAAASVAHPNVVNVYHVGELPRSRTAYFVMQYVDGRSLQDEIVPGQAMPEARARRIFGEIASALSAAHARGVVHRDIKPPNIMIDRESDRVIVLDFGISAALERQNVPGAERLTAEGHSIGTPMYMSPEQASASEVTAKSDIYSLGVVAFELTTGRPPFTASTSMELIAAHIKDAPPRTSALRPDLAPELAVLIDRCLEKIPEKRPAARDLLRALLPSAQPAIEWPPPGLDDLKGRGQGLMNIVNLAFAAVAGFTMMLLRQPMMMSPLRLNAWYQSVSSVSPTAIFDGVLLWFFGLTVLSTFVLLLLPVVAIRAWRLADMSRWARRSGYPWSVIANVAWDAHSDTPALLNGTGRFALLDQPTRSRLLHLRRARSIAVATIPLLLSLGVCTWLVGWTGGWTDSVDILPPSEAAILLGPALVALLIVVWLGQPEARIRLSAARERFLEWRHREPTLRPEILRAWLTAIGSPANSGRRPGVLAALALVAIPALLLVIVGGALVFFAAFVSARAVAGGRGYAESILGSMTTDSLRPTSWGTYDSLFALAGMPPSTAGHVDLAAARQLLGWYLKGSSIPGYVDADTAGRPPDGPTYSSGVVLTFLRPDHPPLDEPYVRNLIRDTMTPAIALFRRIARSAPLPPLWHARPGVPGIENPLLLVSRGFRDASFHNLSAGVLALHDNDPATALKRARENIAVGSQLARSPSFSDHMLGISIISSGQALMDATARASGNAELAGEAEQLRRLVIGAKQDFNPWWRGGAQLLMADPVDPVLLPYVNYGVLSPSQRVELAYAAVAGFCLNTREILFGPDPRRRELLARVGEGLRRVPRADDVVLAQRRELDEWIASPTTANGRYVAALGQWQGQLTNFPMDRLGLGALKNRMLFCLYTFRARGHYYVH